MSTWFNFLKETRRSKDPLTVIVCLPRGRSLNLTVKIWHLRLGMLTLILASIVTPLAIYSSSHLLAKRQKMRQELIDLRNELFAYQVRYDEVYEMVYQEGSKPVLGSLNRLVDPLDSASTIAPSLQEQKDIAEDRSSRPDSLFPDSSFPKLALPTKLEQNPLDFLPVEIKLELIPSGQQIRPSVRISLINLAYPQVLDLRIWLVAMAQSEQAGLVQVAYPSLELIDWHDGQLIKPDDTLALELKDKIWQTELKFPEQDQFGPLSWKEIRVFIREADGEKFREYSYELGQLSANLTSELHLQ